MGTVSNRLTRSLQVQLLIALLGIVILQLCLPSPAISQTQTGRKGKIYTCYRESGEHGGLLRVVAERKKCNRGERRLTWNVTGRRGGTGPVGPQSASNVTLEEQVKAQSSAIDTLSQQFATAETLLQGVSRSQLLDAVNNAPKLNGITAGELGGAIAGAEKLTGISGAEINGAISNATKLTGITGAELGTAVNNAPKLNGITAGELGGAISNASKLNAISGSELTGAISNASKLTGISSAEIGGAIAGAEKLTGISGAEINGAISNASKLIGISGSELTGAISNASKLTGISSAELTTLLASLPRVEALCTRATTLTTQSNALLTALSELKLGGTVPVGLALEFPSLPAALGSFACP